MTIPDEVRAEAVAAGTRALSRYGSVIDENWEDSEASESVLEAALPIIAKYYEGEIERLEAQRARVGEQVAAAYEDGEAHGREQAEARAERLEASLRTIADGRYRGASFIAAEAFANDQPTKEPKP